MASDETRPLEIVEAPDAGDLEAQRLQALVVGAVFGVLLHLGQLEVELLHDGSRFVNGLEVRNPRLQTRLILTVEVAP